MTSSLITDWQDKRWQMHTCINERLATQHVAAIPSFIPRIFLNSVILNYQTERAICSQLIITITFLFSFACGAVCPQVARALKLHTHSRFARLVVPAPPRLIYMRAGIQPIFVFCVEHFFRTAAHVRRARCICIFACAPRFDPFTVAVHLVHPRLAAR